MAGRVRVSRPPISLLRYEVALSVGARGMRDDLVRRKQWLLPLRDAFAFVVWLASFFPQRIHWRDQRVLRAQEAPRPRRVNRNRNRKSNE